MRAHSRCARESVCCPPYGRRHHPDLVSTAVLRTRRGARQMGDRKARSGERRRGGTGRPRLGWAVGFPLKPCRLSGALAGGTTETCHPTFGLLHVACCLCVACFMFHVRVASCTAGRMLQYGATWQVLQPVLAHVGLERCAVHAHTRKHTHTRARKHTRARAHTRACVRAPMRTRVHCRCADSSYSTGSAIKLQTVDFLASVGIKARTD